MKASVIWFKRTASIKKKKGLRNLDTFEDFPRRLRLYRKWECLVCGGEVQLEEEVCLWVVEGSKRTKEGGEEQGNVSLLPTWLVSLLIIVHVISQWAGRVSRIRKKREWVWVSINFLFTSQLISVRSMSGLRENYSFQSYSCGQNQRSWMLLSIYLLCSSSSNVKFLSIDMWIKEIKHVKIPEPNSGN